MDDNRVQEVLLEICESVKPKRNKNGFVCRCPICGDSSKSNRIARLHVDYYPKYQDWIAKCYNGGCPISGSTNLISLYAQSKEISYTQSKKYINDGVYDIDKIKERLRSKIVKQEQPIQNNTDIDIPDECLSVDTKTDDKYQTRYINKLRSFISDRMIPSEYKCYVSHSGSYKGRIIIPVFINNKLMYFQGRSLFDNIEPKYLNPVVDKTGIILNSPLFNKDKYIIVTEGILDAWMVEGHQGTSCLGSYFSDSLVKKLLRLTNKGVILCFDNPLIDKSGYDEINKFISDSTYKSKVKYFIPDNNKHKDLNDIKVNNPDINIYDHVVDTSSGLYSVTAKLKLLYKYSI